MTEGIAAGLERRPRGKDFWLVVAAGLGLAVWYLVTALMAPAGADASRYEDWARAFWTGDPFALESSTLSPTGMPLSQWSHGPGLLAAPFVGLFGGDAVRVLGFALTLGTAWFFFRILSLAARAARVDTLLLFAVALLGTHWGFYALVHSSESLSYFPFAGMVYWVASRRQFGAGDAFIVGCFAYLLVLIRVQLALYYVPVFAWLAWTVCEEMDRRSLTDWRRTLATLLAAALPPVAALVQNGALCALMLGSTRASPYVFGDDGFSSVALAKPELKAVLFHSWHGLLSYHPLYALAYCGLSVLFGTTRTWKQRAVLASLLLVMAVHVLLQAAWFVWWLGTGTYGMRALGLWFVVGVPALAPLLRTRARVVLVTALTLTCLWSFLLLIQTAKPPVYSQYYTMRELLDGQWEAARYCYRNGALHVLLVGVAAWWLSPRLQRGERFVWAVTNALLYLYVFYVIDLNTLHGSRFARLFSGLRPAMRVAAALLVPLVSSAWALRAAKAEGRDGAAGPSADRPRVRAALGFAAVVFLTTNATFAFGMQRMAAKRVPYDPTRYRYCNGVQIEEVLASYQEYLSVPAFKGKKRALKQYLARLDRRSCSLGSSPQ